MLMLLPMLLLISEKPMSMMLIHLMEIQVHQSVSKLFPLSTLLEEPAALASVLVLMVLSSEMGKPRDTGIMMKSTVTLPAEIWKEKEPRLAGVDRKFKKEHFLIVN